MQLLLVLLLLMEYGKTLKDKNGFVLNDCRGWKKPRFVGKVLFIQIKFHKQFIKFFIQTRQKLNGPKKFAVFMKNQQKKEKVQLLLKER